MRFNCTKRFFIFLLICICFNGSLLADPGTKISHGILLQGFGWNSQMRGSPSHWYDLITKETSSIKKLGATMVWFPPVSRSVSPQGYLPGDYYDVGTTDLPTFYGNKKSLTTALKALNNSGISPIADIVVNHRCAGKQDKNGIWNVYHFPSKKASWENWAICRGEYGGTGKEDSGINYGAAPDVDHSNPRVQQDITEWLNWLKKIGFKGWRYDFSKGYAAKYAGMYSKNTSAKFSVGEVWTNMSFYGSQLGNNQNAHRQILCDWLDASQNSNTCVFDFTTKGILQVAVKGEYGRLKDKMGKPSGLIGWWPTRAVTFLDNHDTGSQQSHWPFPAKEVMQGYAYILTHPGIPCIFWEHVYDWNLYNQVKAIVDIRKQYKINSGSKVKILKAENGLYAAIIDGKVAMKLGNKDWSPTPGFKLITSGNNYAIWGRQLGLKIRQSTPVSNK